jgi:hypothetical protein
MYEFLVVLFDALSRYRQSGRKLIDGETYSALSSVCTADVSDFLERIHCRCLSQLFNRLIKSDYGLWVALLNELQSLPPQAVTSEVVANFHYIAPSLEPTASQVRLAKEVVMGIRLSSLVN